MRCERHNEERDGGIYVEVQLNQNVNDLIINMATHVQL